MEETPTNSPMNQEFLGPVPASQGLFRDEFGVLLFVFPLLEPWIIKNYQDNET